MRVIAGSARGRPLRTPKAEVRPTSDKVKGAIFSILEAEAMRRGFHPHERDDELLFAAAQAWPRWLDLYAGSGALGIEALSRGVGAVDFVERDATARSTIAQNLERTALAGRARVLNLTAERLFAAAEHRYDVVLLDPPYAEVEPGELLGRLAAARIVNSGGIVVLEHARGRSVPEHVGLLHQLRSRGHGKTSISVYEQAAED
jgi:16S rRNA (guanine(966)-N(2))-methyltransferase RsmD